MYLAIVQLCIENRGLSPYNAYQDRTGYLGIGSLFLGQLMEKGSVKSPKPLIVAGRELMIVTMRPE